jgi:hypothetical protein
VGSAKAKADSVRFYDDSLHSMASWAVRAYHLGRVRIIGRSYIPPTLGMSSERNGVVSAMTYAFRSGRGIFLTQVLSHELGHVRAVRTHRYFGQGPIIKRLTNELIADWNATAVTP